MSQILLDIFNTINSFFWGYFMIFLLVGTGIYFSIRLGFPQLRRLKDTFTLTLGEIKSGDKADEKGMSSWQSLATAVAGQIGTGNVLGPATAIAAGGPGSVFWIWASAFFGMATIYAEAIAAQKYKSTLSDGTVIGGPSYYIQAAFRNKFGKFLAAAFSVCIIIGFGMAAAMIQGNTIAEAMNNSFHVPTLATGIIMSILLLLVGAGGMGRIARTTEKMVPVMSIFFIVTNFIVLAKYYHLIPEAISAIFRCAFSSKAVYGGAVGISVREAIRYGVARGLFSNEAGMGSTPHAHAVAKVKHPVDQGIVAMMSIIIDTFILLSVTCLLVLVTSAHLSGEPGIGMIQYSYDLVFGKVGSVFIAISVFFFCFATMIAAYFYGEQNFKKLFGVKSFPIYMVLIVGFTIFGAYTTVDLVWAFCDTFNGLMVLTNLIGLLGISGVVIKLSREYDKGGRTLDTSLNDIRNKKQLAKKKE